MNSYRESLRTGLNLFNVFSIFGTTTKACHSLMISTEPSYIILDYGDETHE
jgi:hypothetical protein